MGDTSGADFTVWGADQVAYGPVELPVLVSWVKAERVTAETWIYDAKNADWQKAGKLAELQMFFRPREKGANSGTRSEQPITDVEARALRRVKILAAMTDEQLERFALFMELEKDHLGTKWVINKVHADIFEPYFLRDTTKIGRFLHPMSHELDFMNLRKALANSDSVSQFTVKRFVPDHLSVFLYEIKKGNMRFQSVNEVKFHFFQINGWYFELSEFNRPGYNTGWLMSGLVKLNNDTEKDLIRKHLYYDTQ